MTDDMPDLERLMFVPARFEKLVLIFEALIQKTISGQNYQVLISRYVSHFDFAFSPYIEVTKTPTGQVLMEIPGNMICKPGLSENQIKVMAMLGWHAPEVSEQDFLDGKQFGKSPNFWRVFSDSYTPSLIAHVLVATLYRCYGLSILDQFSFGFAGKYFQSVSELSSQTLEVTFALHPSREEVTRRGQTTFMCALPSRSSSDEDDLEWFDDDDFYEDKEPK